MAYGSKYYTYFKRRSGGTTYIHIYEEDYTGGQTYLKADINPLVITTNGSINNIYEPTKGSGATIKLLVSPLTMNSLFTQDPQKYLVEIYNGTSGGTLTWQGFVNTNIYNEDYSVGGTLLTPITINCNDGMSVLDDLYYKESDGDFYTGCETIGEVINNIIGKLGITFDNVYTLNHLLLTGGTTNLFNNLKVNNRNFVDESNIPMSCREVLDSIFGGLALVMSFKGSDIYIMDPFELNYPSNGLVYTLPNYVESSSPFGGYIDLSGTTLNYYETGQRLDMIGVVSESQTNYDPYTTTDLQYDFNNTNNITNEGTWVDQTGWFLNSSMRFNNWTQSTGTHTVGVRELMSTDPTYGIYLYDQTTAHTITYTDSLLDVYPDNDVAMKISFNAYISTKGDMNIYDESDPEAQIYRCYLPFSLKLGDEYYKGSNTWATGQTGNYIQLLEITDPTKSLAESDIGDQWWPGGVFKIFTYPTYYELHLTGLTGGNLTFTLYDNLPDNYFEYSGTLTAPRILIKDFSIEFIDINTDKPINNNGILTRGNNTTNNIYRTDPHKISLTNGTGSCGLSKGAFKDTDNLNIVGMYSSHYVYGTPRTTMELVLQAFISQYGNPRLKLSMNLDVSSYLIGIDKYLICDNEYLSGKAFYIVSYVYNDRDENMEVELLEITKTLDLV